MTLRRQLKRLEHGLHGHLESFVLADGSRHYYDPECGEIFLHGIDCVRAEYEGKPYPESPETILAVVEARDRRAVLDQVAGAYDDIFPYDKRVLVEFGRLQPRFMAVGCELGEPIEDLSEPSDDKETSRRR